MKVIFGGTFDPVHYGHLQMAEELRQHLSVSEVFLMPCFHAVHKAGVSASADQRRQMLQLACNEYEGLRVDDRELRRGRESYTVDSLLELRSELPQGSLSLVMGTDTAIGLRSWRMIERFPTLTNLVVIQRPHCGELDDGVIDCAGEIIRSLGWKQVNCAEQLQVESHGCYLSVTLSQLQVSSTEVRQRIKKKLSIQTMVPGAVEQFICDNGIYLEPTPEA